MKIGFGFYPASKKRQEKKLRIKARIKTRQQDFAELKKTKIVLRSGSIHKEKTRHKKKNKK